MSGVEDKLCEAFDALSLPEGLSASTLARIEAARAQERADADRAADDRPEGADPPLPDSPAACGGRAAREGRADEAERPQERPAGIEADPPVAPSFRPQVVPGRKRRGALFARRSFRIAVAACLCGALVFGGGTAVYASESAAVEISADTVAGTAEDDALGAGQAGAVSEAAIELGVNRLNIVVRATGLNEAGEALLQAVSVVGKSYEDAAALIMGQDAIVQGGFVSVTVSGGNAGQCDYLDQASETCLGHRAEGSYACESASVEERQAAQEAGMGTARYQAYLELTALDSGVTEELCHDLTLGEMRWMIDALQSGAASTAQEAIEQARAAGVGSGHHAGEAGQGDSGAGHGNGSGAGAGSGSGSGAGAGSGGESANGSGQGSGSGSGQGAGSSSGSGQGSGSDAGQGSGSGSSAGAGSGSGPGGGHGAGHGHGAA